MKLTKEIKEDIKEYIFNCIYSEEFELKNNTQKLEYVLSCFKAEYGFNIQRLGLYKAFSEWLQGLPSCFNIAFYNGDILNLAKKWGQEPKTENQENKIISQWFDFITNQFFKLVKSYKIEY